MMLDALTVAVMCGLITVICSVLFILNASFRRDDRAGRMWVIGFVSAILQTLGYTVLVLQPEAWWGNAVGNAAYVGAVGMLWAGARCANGRPSWVAVAVVALLFSAAATLVHGPEGGYWAGTLEAIIPAALFAGAGAVECLRGAMRRTIHARILAIGLGALSSYLIARSAVFAVTGPEDPLFIGWFGSLPTAVLNLSVLLVASLSLSAFQLDRIPRVLEPDDEVGDGDGLLGTAAFRAHAEVWLRRSVRDRTELLLQVVEVANLSAVNVAFGRGVGDRAIDVVGHHMVDEAPAASLVGRVSSREYAVLMPVTVDSVPGALAERLNTALLQSAVDVDDRFRASTMHGQAASSMVGVRFDDLLEAARADLSRERPAELPDAGLSRS